MTTDAIAGGVAEGLLYMANSAAIKNQAQICAEGKQAIINKQSSQIIDFYEGTSLNGLLILGE